MTFLFRPKAAVVFVCLALLGFLIYSNTLGNPFVHDDVVFIKDNPNIARWDNIAQAFTTPGIPFKSFQITTPYYRPLLEVFYRAEHQLFGFETAGYHAVNITFHILNSFLIYLLLLAAWRVRRSVAFLTAVLFLVHPLQSEAVACISGISNLAVAFFMLLSFWLYVSGKSGIGLKRGLYLAGALLSFAAALFTKEQAVIFPVILAAYEWFSKREKESWVRPLLRLVPFLAAAGAFFLWRSSLFPNFLASAVSNVGELKLRLLVLAKTVLMFLRLVVLPVDLHYYRSIDVLSPVLAAWSILLTLGVGVCIWVQRLIPRMRRQIYFGLFVSVVFFFPAMNIIPLINEYSFILAAEHFMYLPLMGLLLSGLFLLSSLRRFVQGAVSRLVLTLLSAAVVILCISTTVLANTFWRAEIPLFERTLQFEPGFGRVRILLAQAYVRAGHYSSAVEEYEKALTIMETYLKKTGHLKVGLVYKQFIRAVHFDLAGIYATLGEFSKSDSEYRLALSTRIDELQTRESDSADWRILTGLGMNAILQGQKEQAKQYWQTALRLEPGNAEALNNLGMLAIERGDKQAAQLLLKRALKVKPGFAIAVSNLKMLNP